MGCLTHTHTHTHRKHNSGDEDFKMNPTDLQSVLSAVLREQEQRFVQLLDTLRVGHSTSAAVAPRSQGEIASTAIRY